MGSVYRIGEFAKRVGRSVSTVRRWEAEGRITARRLPSGQRSYDNSDVRRVLQPGFNAGRRKVVVYCRVPSPGQKADLASQMAATQQFCLARGLAVDEWISEVGGGMNLRRTKFLALMDAVDRGEVATLVVAHQDRLARFGFDLVEHLAARGGCEIVVANQESLSPRQELVEDLLAVVNSFSGRLDGLRRYEKELKRADLAMEGDR
ncbi:IS607 family transposase [Micromonospora sp. DR5-3]|uniref:IS607 family transposase n=1 Tax=unclassified Micromonospora TaxID=2617518 RepID=UPI0011D632F7|nr:MULTISPECIES: IS607 family transposase [unclassified Micromonospora]MCW3818527.1 IS607 family transposase [Micromonospora sp. DR5-3]TYC20306.1 IS607 family transposase [Micromonospora sp. MP36]